MTASVRASHEVYAKAGFVPFPHPGNLMILGPEE